MLKIAIIGTGGIASAHWEALQNLHRTSEVVALCDISSSQLERFQVKHGISLPVYLNHKEMLKTIKLDCVAICTPPYTHKDISIDALQSGVHAFCEKPMAPSVADCEQMIAAQRKSGKLLGICHQNRFRNDIRKVKQVIDSGLLGKVLFSRIDSFWWRDHSYYDLWWRGMWEKEGGGCLLNHAVHHVDQMLWFLGEPKTMMALCANQDHDNAEVEDFATAMVRFQNGALAQLTGSVICHGEDQQLYFQCEKGKIVNPWDLYCSLGKPNGFPHGRNSELEAEILQLRSSYQPLEHEAHAGIWNNFLDAVEKQETLLVGPDEGKAAIEFITAAYKIAAEYNGTSCQVDTGHPWYTYDGIIKNAPHYYEKTVSADSLEGDISVGKSNA